MINATIVGRLTRDPEQRQASQYTITNFTVASNNTRKNKDGDYDATFVRCAVFGRQGDVIAQRFRKGQPIIVSGELSTSAWQDNQGQQRQSVEMSVHSFSFVPRDTSQEQNEPAPQVSDADMPF